MISIRKFLKTPDLLDVLSQISKDYNGLEYYKLSMSIIAAVFERFQSILKKNKSSANNPEEDNFRPSKFNDLDLQQINEMIDLLERIIDKFQENL